MSGAFSSGHTQLGMTGKRKQAAVEQPAAGIATGRPKRRAALKHQTLADLDTDTEVDSDAEVASSDADSEGEPAEPGLPMHKLGVVEAAKLPFITLAGFKKKITSAQVLFQGR